MLIYLLRHADADTKADNDDERPLSKKGIRQAKRVARFCEKNEIVPDVILTSPLVRAHETAKPLAKHLGVPCKIAPFLASGMTAQKALAGLKELDASSSVMLVGHEPDFSHFVQQMLGAASGASVRIRKASLTLLELPVMKAGVGQLHFSIPCKLMP